MTETLTGSSKRTTKSTCRACNRTVYLVTIDGTTVATDPELIAVVPFEATAEVMRARRLHSEMCSTYVADAQRLKIAAERKRFENKNASKKAPNGKTEPGQ